MRNLQGVNIKSYAGLREGITICPAIKAINEYYWNAKVDLPLLEVRNLICVSELIVRSALQRKESRGLHYTLDYPDLAPQAKNVLVQPLNR